jgi:hypothetical protein
MLAVVFETSPATSVTNVLLYQEAEVYVPLHVQRTPDLPAQKHEDCIISRQPSRLAWKNNVIDVRATRTTENEFDDHLCAKQENRRAREARHPFRRQQPKHKVMIPRPNLYSTETKTNAKWKTKILENTHHKSECFFAGVLCICSATVKWYEIESCATCVTLWAVSDMPTNWQRIHSTWKGVVYDYEIESWNVARPSKYSTTLENLLAHPIQPDHTARALGSKQNPSAREIYMKKKTPETPYWARLRRNPQVCWRKLCTLLDSCVRKIWSDCALRSQPMVTCRKEHAKNCLLSTSYVRMGIPQIFGWRNSWKIWRKIWFNET